MEGTLKPTLFSLKYLRIVLDEAHEIRNHQAKTFKAISNITASNKVAVTGTPYVNRPDDLYALMAFFSVEPLNQHTMFQKYITDMIKNGRPCGLRRLRLAMAHISLRRTKKDTDLGLPKKQIKMVKVGFKSGPHKEIYDALYKITQSGLAAVWNAEDPEIRLEGRRCAFLICMRIRQACCSSNIFPVEFPKKVLGIAQQVNESVRYSPTDGLHLLKTLQGYSQLYVDAVKKKNVTESQIDAITNSVQGMSLVKEAQSLDLGPSPKIAKLVKMIGAIRQDEKGVIFSSFTTLLKEIGRVLDANGIAFTRFDGQMSASQRVTALINFGMDDGPRIMLCSINAGAVGINLTRANHVFLMDPWWNQALEFQAADRVHRIGQERVVHVNRLYMEGTIEERLLEIQKHKATLGRGSMERLSPRDEKRATMTAMKDLFEIPEFDAPSDQEVEAFLRNNNAADDEFIRGDENTD